MKKYMKTVLIVLVCIAITAIPAAFILTNFVLYTPLYDRIPEIKNMGNCTKIELQYSDLSGEGQGQIKTIILEEKEEIKALEDRLLNTMCRRGRVESRDGGTNVTVTLHFLNGDSAAMQTFSCGAVRISKKDYVTNNRFGTYLSRFVWEKSALAS